MSTAPEQPELVKVSAQVPKTLLDAFKAAATAEDRSVSAELRRLMHQRVNEPADAEPTEAAA